MNSNNANLFGVYGSRNAGQGKKDTGNINPRTPGGNVYAVSLTCLLDNCTVLSHDAADLFQLAVKSCGNEGYHE